MLWSKPWVRLKVNGLGSGLGLWSGLRLRGMVNSLDLGLGAWLMVWVKLSVMVWA